MFWRRAIAKAIGIPLDLMQGFYKEGILYNCYVRPGKEEKMGVMMASVPISWDILKDDPILDLLNHSDCNGEIPSEQCKPIADSLKRILPKLDDNSRFDHKADTKQFIKGLMLAHKRNEKVSFR